MANTAAVAAQTQRGKTITLTITQEITTQRVTVYVCVQEFVATVLNRVFEAGFCSNQASVKYLIEWMMILILIQYPQHMDSFWACFNRVSSHSGYIATRKYYIMIEIVKLLTRFLCFLRRITTRPRQASALSCQSWCISMSSFLISRMR